MRNIRRTFILAGALSVIVTNAPARAAPAPEARLVIDTVPRLEGLVFTVDGRRLQSDDQGRALIDLPPGKYTVSTSRHRRLGRARATLLEWSDGGSNRALQLELESGIKVEAGFDVDYLVEESYTDKSGDVIDHRDVDSITVVDNFGVQRTYPGWSPGVGGSTALRWQQHPAGTRWLSSTRIEALDGDLSARQVTHDVQEVTVDGVSVAADSPPLDPAAADTWEVRVLADMPLGRSPWDRLSGEVLAGGAAAAAAFLGLLLLLWRSRARRSDAGMDDGRPPGRRLRLWPRSKGQWLVPGESLPEAFGAVGDRLRVHLRDGKTIEGVRGASFDPGALTLQVLSVRGPDGRQEPSTPLDSFLLLSQITSVERIDDRQAPSSLKKRAAQPAPPAPGVAGAKTTRDPGEVA